MTGRSRERERGDSETAGPVGTVLGMTFGPFGAAIGSVVDANRAAFAFSFGTGVPRRTDDGLDDPATIEIADAGEAASASDADAGENAESDGGPGDAAE